MVGRKRGSIPWNKGVHMWENRKHPRGTLGKIPWNKGKKTGHTPWNKGKNKIDIPKLGNSGCKKGYKQTEEHRKKSLENLTNSSKGKHWKIKDTSKMGKHCIGEKNNKWKGGISRGYKTGYYSTEYKKWRMSVFNRDGFKCQGCGQVGGYLTAHHIKSFAKYPELRFNINNGITLCEACHSLTDNYKGRAKKK